MYAAYMCWQLLCHCVWRLWSPCDMLTYEFDNKVYYSVQPRHLHYADVMLLLCHAWFVPGLDLGLELLSLESKPVFGQELIFVHGQYERKLCVMKMKATLDGKMKLLVVTCCMPT